MTNSSNPRRAIDAQIVRIFQDLLLKTDFLDETDSLLEYDLDANGRPACFKMKQNKVSDKPVTLDVNIFGNKLSLVFDEATVFDKNTNKSKKVLSPKGVSDMDLFETARDLSKLMLIIETLSVVLRTLPDSIRDKGPVSNNALGYGFATLYDNLINTTDEAAKVALRVDSDLLRVNSAMRKLAMKENIELYDYVCRSLEKGDFQAMDIRKRQGVIARSYGTIANPEYNEGSNAVLINADNMRYVKPAQTFRNTFAYYPQNNNMQNMQGGMGTINPIPQVGQPMQQQQAKPAGNTGGKLNAKK